jgi:hypothetical protein
MTQKLWEGCSPPDTPLDPHLRVEDVVGARFDLVARRCSHYRWYRNPLAQRPEGRWVYGELVSEAWSDDEVLDLLHHDAWAFHATYTSSFDTSVLPYRRSHAVFATLTPEPRVRSCTSIRESASDPDWTYVQIDWSFDRASGDLSYEFTPLKAP